MILRLQKKIQKVAKIYLKRYKRLRILLRASLLRIESNRNETNGINESNEINKINEIKYNVQLLI